MCVQWYCVLNFAPIGTIYFKDILQLITCYVLTIIIHLFKIIKILLSNVFVIYILYLYRKYVIYRVFYDDTLKTSLYIIYIFAR